MDWLAFFFMTIRTPNNIDILLHFHCSPTKHERREAPAVIEGIQILLEAGALEPDANRGEGHFRTTPKGRAWVESLCNVEEPRAAWVDAHGTILG